MRSTAENLVVLDRDHPGFRDAGYRARRNEIARLALAHVPGMPFPEVQYTPSELRVWQIVLSHLGPLHRRLACREFLGSWSMLGFVPEHLPRFAEVNAVLQRTTGFSLQPAAGLITPRLFLESLAEDAFFATQYLRHPSTPLYTPEPDLIHELIGHAVLLADPTYAHLHRLFGHAARAADDEQIQKLIRLYWYTIEFGLAKDGDALRVVGAGLLSSAGEMGRMEQYPSLRPFDIQSVFDTPYEPTDYQPVLFVAKSPSALYAELGGWLEQHCRR